MTYKETFEQINLLVEKIENGDPDVDELTNLINEALKLIKTCQSKLRETEQNIEESFENGEETV